MPREIVTVQIGQCGLQVGTKFWELALHEHQAYNPTHIFDESMSTFFRNVDVRSNPPLDLPLTDNQGRPLPMAALKARAVLVDMEEGVLGELLNRASLRELFDERQTVHSVSGSGNNWAHGHCHYGPLYGDAILESVRRQVEHTDSLQAFFLVHSLGGGTGSGLGTYILSALKDAYPDIYRFNTGIFPSNQDDVVTSPYNSALALGELIAHADAVMPVHNQALMDICERINNPRGAGAGAGAGAGSGDSKVLGADRTSLLGATAAAMSSAATPAERDAAKKAAAAANKKKSSAFDDMNTIAAQLLTSLTCSMRFEGALNVDLNEITMNLVPFPRMHFLVSSLAPLYTSAKDNHALKFGGAGASASSSAGMGADARVRPSPSLTYGASKSIDDMFTTLFKPKSHLVQVDASLRHSACYLACGIFARGPDLTVADLNRNIARMRPQLRLVDWNDDGFKVGLCSTPPVGLRSSLLSLANSTAVAPLMTSMLERVNKLYSRRAHFHHYLEYMEEDRMEQALRRIQGVVADYQRLERDQGRAEERGGAPTLARMQPLG